MYFCILQSIHNYYPAYNPDFCRREEPILIHPSRLCPRPRPYVRACQIIRTGFPARPDSGSRQVRTSLPFALSHHHPLKIRLVVQAIKNSVATAFCLYEYYLEHSRNPAGAIQDSQKAFDPVQPIMPKDAQTKCLINTIAIASRFKSAGHHRLHSPHRSSVRRSKISGSSTSKDRSVNSHRPVITVYLIPSALIRISALLISLSSAQPQPHVL